MLLRDGDQLELRFEGWPWHGQSPRDLTRAAFLFSFPAPATVARGDEDLLERKMIEDHLQLDFFGDATAI